MLELSEYTKRSKDLLDRAKQVFCEANLDFKIETSNSGTIRLVFAGQYSAGKSSILRMLTGRTDIAIGAGITTSRVHSYDWDGLEVVDTPGIHTELRPDHDKLSYEAIASADMLVFVVTNELFDSYLADHFRKLAIDKDKAGEMILVVNKMDRTSEGNTYEQQKIIRDDLVEVLSPFTPEQMNLCFLDAESYIESLDEEDTEISNELRERSGYNKFVDVLNHFVSERKIPSKLTTQLYELDEKLQKGINDLQPKSADQDIDALEESFMQQRHVLLDASIRLRQEVKDIFTTAASRIREVGIDSANLLCEGCKEDEVEDALAQSIRTAEDIIERSQQDAIQVIDERLTEMGYALDRIENSEFSQELKARLNVKFDRLPDNIKRILSSAVPGLQKAGQTITSNAYKTGISSGLKLTNFSGSNIHNIVLKAGHTIGFKFKPWQAIKVTKGIAIGGRALGCLGVGLSIFIQLKEDADSEQLRSELRRNRQNVRSQFNSAASELEDFGRRFIKETIDQSLRDPIEEIDKNIHEIRASRTGRSNLCRNLELLQSDCRELIREIHNS